jgi:hypothetical protein
MSKLTIYIDEGGDSGVKDGLRYHGTRYEWLVLAAYIVRTKNLTNCDVVRNEIINKCKIRQSPDIHYYKMKEDRRQQACEILSKHPAQAIVFLSHKSNMREHQNTILGQTDSQKFYNWCTKLLLERVLEFCHLDSIEKNYPLEPIDIIFSEIKSHDYDGMFGYFENMNLQKIQGKGKLRPKFWLPEMMKRENWRVAAHETNAGLQLVDIVASSFLQGANSNSQSFNPERAKTLKPIIARNKNNIIRGNGVTLWPLPRTHGANIPTEARPLFEFYGYDFKNN